MNEFQFLISHLKNKKDILSRYYLATAYFNMNKLEQAEKKYIEILETLSDKAHPANSPKKATNKFNSETMKENHLKSAIFFYMGLILKKKK